MKDPLPVLDTQIKQIQVLSCSHSSLFGWLVSSMLAKALRHTNTQICHSIVYQSKSEAASGYKANNPQGLTLSADLLLTLTKLGLSESTLRAHASANYHLADEFINWHQDRRKTLVSIAPTGGNFEGVKFLHYWARARLIDCDIGEFEDFSFNNRCVRLNRFTHPIGDPRSVLSTLEYGLSVDSKELHSLLREAALTLGVNEDFTAEKLLDSHRNKTKADVIFDCRASMPTANRQNTQAYALAMSHSVIIKTPIGLQRDSQEQSDLVTQYCAVDDGYIVSRRVGSNYHNKIVFNAEKSDMKRLSTHLSSMLDISSKDLYNHLKHKAEPLGQSCSPFWYTDEKTTQMITLSQSGLFNLMSDGGLSFAVQTIDEWLKRMPRKIDNELLMRHFNQSIQAYFDSAFDLNILKFYAALKVDTPFWQALNKLNLSNNIRHFVALFQQTGVFPSYEFYPQELDYYQNLLIGLGHCPEQVDPISLTMPESTLLTRLDQLSNQLTNTAKGLPKHSPPQAHANKEVLLTH